MGNQQPQNDHLTSLLNPSADRVCDHTPGMDKQTSTATAAADPVAGFGKQFGGALLSLCSAAASAFAARQKSRAGNIHIYACVCMYV